MINPFKKFWKNINKQEIDLPGAVMAPMTNEEIAKDPQKAFEAGVGLERIKDALEKMGWNAKDINDKVSELHEKLS
jgi:hypothetical protein